MGGVGVGVGIPVGVGVGVRIPVGVGVGEGPLVGVGVNRLSQVNLKLAFFVCPFAPQNFFLFVSSHLEGMGVTT